MRYTQEKAALDKAWNRLIGRQTASLNVEITKSGRVVIKEFSDVRVTMPPKDAKRVVGNPV